MKYVNSNVTTGNFCKSCQNMGGETQVSQFFFVFSSITFC